MAENSTAVRWDRRGQFGVDKRRGFPKSLLTGFTDSRSCEMYILLLTVPSLTLERLVSLFAVDEHVTSDDTHSDSSGQDLPKNQTKGQDLSHEMAHSICIEKTLTSKSVVLPCKTRRGIWKKGRKSDEQTEGLGMDSCHAANSQHPKLPSRQ